MKKLQAMLLFSFVIVGSGSSMVAMGGTPTVVEISKPQTRYQKVSGYFSQKKQQMSQAGARAQQYGQQQFKKAKKTRGYTKVVQPGLTTVGRYPRTTAAVVGVPTLAYLGYKTYKWNTRRNLVNAKVNAFAQDNPNRNVIAAAVTMVSNAKNPSIQVLRNKYPKNKYPYLYEGTLEDRIVRAAKEVNETLTSKK